jgi:hypothetical protein
MLVLIFGFSLLILYGFVSCAFKAYLFFFKEGNALYDVHKYIELSTIFRNIQIFLEPSAMKITCIP